MRPCLRRKAIGNFCFSEVTVKIIEEKYTYPLHPKNILIVKFKVVNITGAILPSISINGVEWRSIRNY